MRTTLPTTSDFCHAVWGNEGRLGVCMLGIGAVENVSRAQALAHIPVILETYYSGTVDVSGHIAIHNDQVVLIYGLLAARHRVSRNPESDEVTALCKLAVYIGMAV